MALGENLSPAKAQVTPDQIRADTKTITGVPASSGLQSKMQQILSNPRMFSFLANTAAGLLTSQGIGPALAGGLSGVGRYEATKRGFDIERQKLAEAAAKKKGGGSGGGTAGPSGDGFKESPKFWAAVEKRTKDLMDAADGDMSYGDARSEAIMMVMSEFGDPSAYTTYLNSDDADKATLRSMFAPGANAGKQQLSAYFKAAETQAKNNAAASGAEAKTREQTGGGADVGGVAPPSMDTAPAMPSIGMPDLSIIAPGMSVPGMLPGTMGSTGGPLPPVSNLPDPARTLANPYDDPALRRLLGIDR